MSFLVANTPRVRCYIRKEFLYNFEKGFGEYVPCIWVSIKSMSRRAFFIESYLPEYGALYDKLPLEAYVSRNHDLDRDTFLPLDHLQIWDCLSYDMAVIEKSNLRGLKVKFFGKDKQFHFGNYLFTIDFASPESNRLDTSFSEGVEEHKSYNFIRLDNGQFACQPNNRCLWYDVSLVPAVLKTPDFKIPTEVYSVENHAKWSAKDEWFYNFDAL